MPGRGERLLKQFQNGRHEGLTWDDILGRVRRLGPIAERARCRLVWEVCVHSVVLWTRCTRAFCKCVNFASVWIRVVSVGVGSAPRPLLRKAIFDGGDLLIQR